MKILHLDFDDMDNPNGGGQAVRTFEINRRLAKRGHQITVVTLHYRNAKKLVKEGINYERAGLVKNPFNFISYIFTIPEILKKHDFDLVVEDNVPPITFGLTPLYTKKPVISLCQCFFARYSAKKNHLPFWIVEKKATKLYKNFIVLTNTMKDTISMLNPKANISVIPNGLSEVYPAHIKHQNYLLFLGRIDFFHKGLDYLVEIMKELKKLDSPIKLKIAGNGNVERLKKIISKEKLDNVDYIGKISGQTKETAIKNCMLLVQPSRFEIFPFAILEAASWGKPVICFAIDNLKEIVQANDIGLTIKPFDTKTFAKIIVELSKNHQNYHNLCKNAHLWAQKHRWEDIAKTQEKLYYSCLHK